MKYLFLIIRHIFPRKRWVESRRYNCKKSYTSGTEIEFLRVELKDQFGNIKWVDSD